MAMARNQMVKNKNKFEINKRKEGGLRRSEDREGVGSDHQ